MKILGYSQVGKAGAFEALILSLVQIQLPQLKLLKTIYKKVVDKVKLFCYILPRK